MTAVRRRSGGFTLVELMMALAVLAVLLVMGAFAFRDLVRRHKVVAASNALRADISYARSEAIHRGNVVSICASVDATYKNCDGSGKSYQRGWIVYTYGAGAAKVSKAYVDGSDLRLRVGQARDGVRIQPKYDTIPSFDAQGQLHPSIGKPLTFAICFLPAGADAGSSTAAVPGVQLTVKASGGVVSKTLGVQKACKPD